VCQDFAHILLVMLRHVSIPARYVSGYICPNRNGMRGEGATHAWVDAYIPTYGWLGLDPTNNCVVNDTHVRLAVGRHFSDCSPVKGVYKGAPEHELKVIVSVSYHNDEAEKEEVSLVPVVQPKESGRNSFKEHQKIMEQQQQ
jgi:transglutaminase-like putative cysteine protease